MLICTLVSTAPAVAQMQAGSRCSRRIWGGSEEVAVIRSPRQMKEKLNPEVLALDSVQAANLKNALIMGGGGGLQSSTDPPSPLPCYTHHLHPVEPSVLLGS